MFRRRLRIVASNVALCVRLEGNTEGNIGNVALIVALFVRLEGNKSLTFGSGGPDAEATEDSGAPLRGATDDFRQPLQSRFSHIHFAAQALSSSTDVPALKRSPAATFAPLAREAMFSPDEPMPLEPDVANGMMVLSVKS